MKNYKSVFMTACFPFLGSIIVIASLAPIKIISFSEMSPDVLFCFMFIILFRFPKNIPLISVLYLSLLADFLWFRPVGLTTLTTVITFEFMRWLLRSRIQIGLFEELIYVTLILVISTTLNELVKFFTLIPSIATSYIVEYIFITLLTYLLIILLMRGIMKTRLVQQKANG